MNDKTAKELFSELEHLLDCYKVGALKRFKSYVKGFKDHRTMEQARPAVLNLIVSYHDTLRNNPISEFSSMDLNLLGIFQEIEALVDNRGFNDLMIRVRNSNSEVQP